MSQPTLAAFVAWFSCWATLASKQWAEAAVHRGLGLKQGPEEAAERCRLHQRGRNRQSVHGSWRIAEHPSAKMNSILPIREATYAAL